MLDDFGDVLTGARKHKYQHWRQKLALVPDRALNGTLLSKSFPTPPYERLLAEGVAADIVAAVRALRDALTFTNKGYRRQPRAHEVQVHRSCAVDLLDGAVSVVDMLQRFGASKCLSWKVLIPTHCQRKCRSSRQPSSICFERAGRCTCIS